jgi:hypothetical protein
VQLEICSDISRIPKDVYHRADAARDCLMHSLAVLPIWMPSISRTAPIAVLELLQPDPQPDFEALCQHVRVSVGKVLLWLLSHMQCFSQATHFS